MLLTCIIPCRKGGFFLMANHFYGLRLKKDIEVLVKRHLSKIKKNIKITLPDHIFMKTFIYWPFNEKTEIESFDIPEFDLQATIEGTNWMKNKLLDYGRRAAVAPRPAGLDASTTPLGISISVETVIPDSLVPINDEGDLRAEGPPVLLLAGSLSNGKFTIMTLPVALTKITKRRVLGLPASEELLNRIENIRVKGIDFLKPFFDGFNSGKQPEKPFSVIK
jgi:hypothetical protein